MRASAPEAPPCWRTFLFVPADRAERVQKAIVSGADAVIADLEDSVRVEHKDAAREQARSFVCAQGGPGRLVRINDPGTPAGLLDLDAMRQAQPAAVMVPKATADSVRTVVAAVPRVVALVETPGALREVAAIAGLHGVLAMALGTVDLSAELGLRPLPHGEELLAARSGFVIDCAAKGIPSIDGAFVDTGDEAGLREEAGRARGLGFAGKLCIHPCQLAPVREAFQPSRAEVDRATRVVDAFEASADEGAILVDGQMVDVAVARNARRVLAEAGERR